MIVNDVDFFEYKDNFKTYVSVQSKLIKGSISENIPLISLIIPTYKCNPKFLKESIDSAVNQNDFQDYEILIIDNDPEVNCSTHLLINSYNNDKIIYYKNCQNIGMFGNWNRGIELSRSNWVAFLHDDDIASPFFLATCSSFLKDHNIGIIKPRNVKFCESKELIFNVPKKIKFKILKLINFIWGCEIGAPTNIIYNKNTLQIVGGFNETYFPSGDYVMAINCAKISKIIKIDAFLGGYRIAANESLNELTMRKFYKIRFKITSFIMRKYHFPVKVICFIQSSLMDRLIRNTNFFYKTNISFDYVNELGLTKKSKITQDIVYILYRITRIFI